jgi:ligand-binding sensor domain-containing protein
MGTIHLGQQPLIYDQVRDMTVDHNNEVWATMSEFGQITQGGVARYDGTAWELFTSSNSNIPTQVVEGIAVDAQNNKWIGSNMGLIKYDGFNWIVYHTGNSGISGDNVTDVLVDSLNRVWAMTGGAIDIFDGTTWTHINSSNSPCPVTATLIFMRVAAR